MSGRSGLLLVLGLLAGLAGCGAKSDPVPPSPVDERQEADRPMATERAD